MQILGFIGSVRDSKPPKPARVGQRGRPGLSAICRTPVPRS